MVEEIGDCENIFIVRVGGSGSKTINIPEEVCEFCGINQGDLIKLKLIDKKSELNKKKK